MRLTSEDLKGNPEKLREVAGVFVQAEEAFAYLYALCEATKYEVSMGILEGTITPEKIAEKRAELKGLLGWREIVDSVLEVYAQSAERADRTGARDRLHRSGGDQMA